MTRTMRPSTWICLVVLGSLLAWQAAPDAVRAQDAPGAPWLAAGRDFAQALSTGDVSLAVPFTTPEYQARLVAAANGSPLGCRLTADGLTQHGSLLRADYGAVQLLCRHPDGVEEFVTVTVRQTGAGWRVCGGFTPR